MSDAERQQSWMGEVSALFHENVSLRQAKLDLDDENAALKAKLAEIRALAQAVVNTRDRVGIWSEVDVPIEALREGLKR